MVKTFEEYHNMDNSLEYEKSRFEEQDNFYRKLNVENIQRISYDDDKDTQRKDIDVILTKDNKLLKISEKNRKDNYGDFLIEIYSVYEQGITGWLDKSESDYMFYFVEDRLKPYVCLISSVRLKELYLNDIKPNIDENKLKSFSTSKKNWEKIQLKIKNRTYKCDLIKARNKNYNTISISVPYTIFNDFGVSYKLFTWNGKEIDKERESYYVRKS